MNIGKLLAILGGAFTIIAMFLFVLFVEGTYYSYVIGAYITFNSVIVNVSTHAVSLGVGEWVIYLSLVGYVVFSVTGFIQLGGVKSKLAAIIGSIIPLFVGILLMLNAFTGIFSGFRELMNLFIGPPLFAYGTENYIPISAEISGIGFGTYLLVIGSLMTFISIFFHEKTKT
jgi:hypothetical protein